MPMFILVLFAALPLGAGVILEYLACRLTMARRKWVRAAPPLAAAALTAAVALGRYRVWGESDVSPLTQLLFVPGLPALFGFLGLLLGWRLWNRLWGPRVIRDRRAE